MDAGELAGWESGPGTLPERLGRALERALIAGACGDEPLPSERRLARALGVSRGTVTAAYAELKERRLVASRPGGYTVPDRAALAAPMREARLAARGMVRGTILQSVVERDPSALDLTFALLDPPAALHGAIREAYAGALPETPRTEYYAAGLPELRARIADWYAAAHGLPTVPEEIVVTQGAYQAIALATLMTCSPGDAVLAESPLYPGALDLFRAYSARIRGLGSFDDPAALDALERGTVGNVALVYACSAYRNPTGTPLAARAAARLARWSAKSDVPVIDDRALALCGFSGTVPRPLAAYAPGAPILTLGSLDKTTGAATRIGWIRAPRAHAAKLARLRALTDMTSPPFLQRVALRLVDRLDAFARERRTELASRAATLTGELRRRLPSWRWETPSGGASLWVDAGADAEALARAAARAGVGIIPGAAFRPEGTSGTWVRLAFALPEPLLVEAVRRLASAV